MFVAFRKSLEIFSRALEALTKSLQNLRRPFEALRKSLEFFGKPFEEAFQKSLRNYLWWSNHSKKSSEKNSLSER